MASSRCQVASGQCCLASGRCCMALGRCWMASGKYLMAPGRCWLASGRQPLYVPALLSCMSYRQCLALKPRSSLVGLAEMADMAGQGKDCWLSRVQIIEKLVKLPIHSSGLESKIVVRHIKAKFASFWLQQIVAEKPGPGGLDHTNLLTV